jgi:very-short-patch-repair endonuclease
VILPNTIIFNSELKKYARELRKGMTDAENKLWSVIRLKQLNGLQFYRQRIIGSYIVDFFCPQVGIVIEVDGSQHYTSEATESDRKRDKYMKARGFKVLRYDDNEVLTNIEGVFENIRSNLSLSQKGD